MTIQMEVWHLITLLLSFFGCIGGFGKVLLDQFEKRLSEKFAAQEASRRTAKEDWDRRFGDLDKGQRSLERDFLELKADLPINYVRREDQVRESTIINAKLDALNSKLDLSIERWQR